MASKPITSRQYQITTQILFFAMLAGQIIFAGLAWFLVNKQLFTPQPDLVEAFTYVLPLVAIGAFLASNILYKNLIKKARQGKQLSEKLVQLRPALIIRFALLESVSLLATIGYLLTGNAWLLLTGLFVIVVFVLLRPTVFQIENDLGLSRKEKEDLENPDTIVGEMGIDGRFRPL